MDAKGRNAGTFDLIHAMSVERSHLGRERAQLGREIMEKGEPEEKPRKIGFFSKIINKIKNFFRKQ